MKKLWQKNKRVICLCLLLQDDKLSSLYDNLKIDYDNIKL